MGAEVAEILFGFWLHRDARRKALSFTEFFYQKLLDLSFKLLFLCGKNLLSCFAHEKEGLEIRIQDKKYILKEPPFLT
jgi:hypothetical protein